MAKLTSTDIYGSLYIQGATAVDSTLSATQLTSTIANGTAPLIVASSKLVTNLNADLLDGQHASYYAPDSGVVHLAGAETITGIKTFTAIPVFNGGTTGSTAPFTVDSTFLVTNLNADYLDGQHGSYYTTAGNLTGTIPSTVLGNSTVYIGTTAVALNRASATLALTGVTNTNWDAAYTATNDATNANTASTIVKRDTNGNFSAGTITASLSGNATSANKVNKSFIIKSDSGTTEGTSLYTFDGSASKTLNLKSGTNVTLTEEAGSITFSSPPLSITNGTGDYVSGISVDGHKITETKASWPTFNQNTTGTAAKADTVKTVTTDNNANFYPTFVDSNNASAGYEAVYTDDVLYYNPYTNTLNLANLTVTGNMSINNVEMINTSSGIVFEGTTKDDFETTLNVINPTLDRSILLPDASGTIALTSSTVAAVANSLTLKIDTGTTEGTDLYTFNGSGAKTLDFKSGTNVTLTDTAGVVTFSSPSLDKAANIGTGSFVTDVAVSGHTITLSKGNFTETTLSKVDGSGDYMSDITVSGHAITEVKSNFSTLTISTGLSGTSYKPNAATTISLTEITPGTAQTAQGALWYHGITPEAGKFDGSTTNPSGTTRLNYGGYLYATRLYDNGARVLTSQSNDFGTFAINGTDSGYTWGIVNTNTNQTADTLSDTLTFVKGGGINLYTNTVAGTDAIKIEHADTSSQASLTATARTYITALTLDTYGHVTGLSTGTETVVDKDTTYSQSWVDSGANAILRLSAGGSGTGNDDLTLVAGSNITLTPSGDNLTISSTYTNTLNTAGSTDTSSKIFLVGATTQDSSAQTYSDNEVYVTSGTLTTKEVQVGGTAATMKYDSTSKSVKFVFA